MMQTVPNFRTHAKRVIVLARLTAACAISKVKAVAQPRHLRPLRLGSANPYGNTEFRDVQGNIDFNYLGNHGNGSYYIVRITYNPNQGMLCALKAAGHRPKGLCES